jgi:signal transduction histidine kinase
MRVTNDSLSGLIQAGSQQLVLDMHQKHQEFSKEQLSRPLGITSGEGRAVSPYERDLVEISDREQRRIAQELHENLSQQLVGAAFLARALADKCDGNAAMAERLKELSAVINSAVEQTRSFNIPSILVAGEECLVPALHALVNSTRRVRTSLELPQSISIGDPRTAMHLFQIVQEAFSNAVRHSGGSHVHVALIDRDDDLCAEVEDDGEGEPDRVQAQPGAGIRLMYIRARIISANLVFEASAKGGIRVKCVVPKRP